MNFLNKLERKFGRYAIKNLYLYMIIVYGIGGVLGLINEGIYYNYLSLDVEMILKGQIWRIFTYVIAPVEMSGFEIVWTVLKMYMFYIFGQSLVNAWGDFRFNLFIFSGFLFNIVAAFILYFVTLAVGYPISYFPGGMDYIYQSMFFAIAIIYPDTVFFMSFIIPIKAKWLAIFDAVMLGIELIQEIKLALVYPEYWAYPVSIIAASLNFIIFFFATRNYKRISPSNMKRRAAYKKTVNSSRPVTHRCAVCGRTPQDDPNLEFRYCSRCRGNYEYCNEHLFTHEHIK